MFVDPETEHMELKLKIDQKTLEALTKRVKKIMGKSQKNMNELNINDREVTLFKGYKKTQIEKYTQNIKLHAKF